MVDAKVLVHDLLLKMQAQDTTASDRRKAEDSLKSLSQFTVQHCRDLCDIISDPYHDPSSKHFTFNFTLCQVPQSSMQLYT